MADEIEIQLGHSCNDRCVFCVSGRLTQAGQAPVLPFETLAARVRDAFAAGHRRITLLGGEPTIQPAFLALVRLAVELGYEGIVIFTNGSKAGATDLIDRVVEIGGKVEWRFSVQGATREAHERTTGRAGGFDEVLRAIELARAREQRTTVNMCLVKQNFESIEGYGALLGPFGIAQMHLDVLNPQDTGGLDAAELSAIMPRHSDVAGPLERMIPTFPAGTEISIGSLPYCVAPELAPWIRHDHVPMWTVTAHDGGSRALQPARYLARGKDKVKPASCTSCVFDAHCTGVFHEYALAYGTDELVPVMSDRLESLQSGRRLVALRMRPWLRSELTELAPWIAEVVVEERSLREVFLTMKSRDGDELRLLFFDGPGAMAASDWCALRIERVAIDRAVALETLRALWSHLEKHGMRTLYPPGDDAVLPTHPYLLERLQLLRQGAPFGAMAWTATHVLAAGRRLEVTLQAPDDEPVTAWFVIEAGRAGGGYSVSPATVTDGTNEGLRQMLQALGHEVGPPGTTLLG